MAASLFFFKNKILVSVLEDLEDEEEVEENRAPRFTCR